MGLQQLISKEGDDVERNITAAFIISSLHIDDYYDYYDGDDEDVDED